MASSLANTATFVVSNMKPDPGEQADALWAQKIADNTGFVYGRPLRQSYARVVANIPNSLVSGYRSVAATAIMDEPFYRPAGHNKLYGTAYATTNHGVGDNSYDSYGTLQWGLYGDLGTAMLGTSRYSNSDLANYTRNDTFATTLDLDSYVSVGSWAQMRYTVVGTTTDPDTGNLGSMAWQLNNIKVHTTWG